MSLRICSCCGWRFQPTEERTRLCHWCYTHPEQAGAAREADWTPLPDPPPIRPRDREERPAPRGVKGYMPIFEDEWTLPDRLAVLPARPWRMMDIRRIAAAPRVVWTTADIEQCLIAFGWRRDMLLREGRWLWRWIPPRGCRRRSETAHI